MKWIHLLKYKKYRPQALSCWNNAGEINSLEDTTAFLFTLFVLIKFGLRVASYYIVSAEILRWKINVSMPKLSVVVGSRWHEDFSDQAISLLNLFFKVMVIITFALLLFYSNYCRIYEGKTSLFRYQTKNSEEVTVVVLLITTTK